jgi:hypothetical protein
VSACRTPGHPAAAPCERGFALVGVVMFVLVLTILALSLFSLTGYESQFMQHSLDRSEVFHAAAGGLDRACFALSRTSRLESVKDDLPLDDVVYAVALRGDPPESTGTINWDDPTGPDIRIRVMAQKNGETRFLEAMYDPGRSQGLYKRLMALSGIQAGAAGLTVLRTDPNESDEPNWQATCLFNEIWQNAPNDPDVINPVNYNNQPPDPAPYDPPLAQPSLLLTGGVPDPDLISFFAQHTGVTSAGSGPSFTFDALAAPDKVKFFQSLWTSGSWSMNLNQPVTVNVRGTAIWLLDRGLRSRRQVKVYGSGDPTDILVIVARPHNHNPASEYQGTGDWADDPGAGIALFGSIDSPNVPVILVSDGGVLVENVDFGDLSTSDDKKASTVNCLSIFARYARVLGPDADGDYTLATGRKMILSHPPNATANALVDKLSDLADLPNTAGALRGRLRFLAGTWREVTESNP